MDDPSHPPLCSSFSPFKYLSLSQDLSIFQRICDRHLNMHRSQFSERELRLEAERNVKYRGTARVRLEALHFQWNEPRELSRKNVERLKEIFGGDKRSCENIRLLDPRNHIPAVIEQSVLDDAILASKGYRRKDC
ncbi:hypothetical protein DL95DRAFT_106948 [Leptodontidium sp. 2 PMI_412]|nr:hypothetical protein DL95DRAFT_106948 [Leptodontidium sp. 2 PMI_412]